MDKTARERYKQRPVLADKVIQHLRKGLATRLEWIDTTFGRAYAISAYEYRGSRGVVSGSLAEDINGILPAAYIGNGEYTSLLPNDKYGNFLWFDTSDPIDYSQVSPQLSQVRFECSLIIWFNYAKIFGNDSFIYLEEVKSEVLHALITPGMLEQGESLQVMRIYDKPENIFRGYSVDAIDSQFCNHPYGAIRLELELVVREMCYGDFANSNNLYDE